MDDKLFLPKFKYNLKTDHPNWPAMGSGQRDNIYNHSVIYSYQQQMGIKTWE